MRGADAIRDINLACTVEITVSCWQHLYVQLDMVVVRPHSRHMLRPRQSAHHVAAQTKSANALPHMCTRSMPLQLCFGPVCVPCNLLLPFLLGLAHRAGWLHWFKREWLTVSWWRERLFGCAQSQAPK